ncbi:hypothetical protein [Peribacillus frigoritolerans]|uniref:hypothetical protein n=1 Tax=Peribacillus frigoritolerans TaxID=450367 RepID=UPI003F7D135D
MPEKEIEELITLIKRAQADPAMFHKLIYSPESLIQDLNLERIIPMNPINPWEKCGATCEGSCWVTCGHGSCAGTCGVSCGRTSHIPGMLQSPYTPYIHSPYIHSPYGHSTYPQSQHGRVER